MVVLMQVILFSVPEAIAITSLAIALAGSEFRFRKALLIGCLLGLISMATGLFSGSYLTNVLICTLVLIGLLTFFKISSPWERLTSATLGVSMYLLMEFMNIKVLTTILKVDPVQAMENIMVRFLWFLPQLLLAFTVTLLLLKFNISLFIDDSKQG